MSAGNLPYNSFGNGAAMRISPAGWAFDGLDRDLWEVVQKFRNISVAPGR